MGHLMPTVIVPTGLSLGQDFEAGDPAQRPAEFWQVHFGTVTEDLSRDEAIVWGAAFTDVQAHMDHEMSRDRLASLIPEDSGVADPVAVVSKLLARGLLVEFDPASVSVQRVFREHQLFPLVQGMGNSPENPTGYEIGIAGQTLVVANADVYAIWSYALTCRSLWDACAELAAGLDEDLGPGEEPLGLTTEGVAGDLATAVPVLVATGCAYLDPVNYRL